MLYIVTFTINIPPMLAYIPYMDPMGSVDWELLRSDDKKKPCPCLEAKHNLCWMQILQIILGFYVYVKF